MTNPTNFADFLLAGKDPDRVALCLLGGDVTYGELEAAAGRVVPLLVKMGCRPGDRVLLLAENGFFWVAAYLGAMRAGCVVVPLPPGIAAKELDGIRQATAPKAAFVQAGALSRTAGSLTGLPVTSDIPECGNPGTTAPKAAASGDDLAALMFTSGSTGAPRGVMISHANLVANTESIIEYLRLTPADRIMAVLPFSYCFGASLLHTHLRVGGSLVPDSRFVYPEVVLERMIATCCTGFAGVPSHYQILLRSSGLRKKTFPHLRYVQQAGGCLAKPLLADLREALPRTSIFVMYGQTEATARLSYLPPEYLERKLGSVGKSIPGVRLRVLNERGEPVRPGEVGEIVAEGPNIARGYWGCPEESAAIFRNGRLYTGDLATLDEDGFLYIAGRDRDFLKCRGERVSCRQLEEKLLECGDLVEAAVIGTPDEVLGESVKAFVVARNRDSGGVQESLIRFCRQRLPAHLVPKEIIAVPALPKNSAGKVVKSALLDL